MALATLTIDLVAKLGNIEQDLGRLNHLVDQTAGRMSSSFSSAKRAAEGLVGVLVPAPWSASSSPASTPWARSTTCRSPLARRSNRFRP